MDFLTEILPFFPNAHIYKSEELIIEPKNNIYFRIDNVSNDLEFKCKLLEYVSRPCFKGVSPYWQRYFSRGLRSYFRTTWSHNEFDLIYTKLGNRVNRNLCIEFIISGYDLSVLKS